MAPAGGGSLDQIQIDLVLNTIAQTQQLQQFTRYLEQLGKTATQQRTALGQFGAGSAASWKDLNRSGKELSKTLQEGFGPRFISSMGQANSALIRIGTTLGQYGAKAVETGEISKAQAVNFQALSGSISGIGVSGQVSVASLQNLINQLNQIKVNTVAGRSAINALNLELQGLQGQIQRIEVEKNLVQPLTGAAAAGQGLLLSFSLAQALAGRLSGALFGLGFALIFTKTGFLNLVTVLTALGATALTIGLDKLQKSLKHEVKPAADIANEALERFKKQLEAIQALSDIELPDAPDWAMPDVKEQIIANRQLGQSLVELARQGEPVGPVFQEMADELSHMPDSLREAQHWGDTFQRFSTETSAFMKEATRSVEQGIQDILDDFARADALELRLQPIEIKRDQINAAFDAQNDALQEQLSQAEDTIRAAGESQVDARRRALRDEVDAIREGYDAQTDAIREKLENQLEAIRNASEKQVDAIRDNLDKQLELITDQTDIKIELIRKSAEKEITANKDKIDILQKQERELTQTLSALRNRREEVRADIIGQEAQLAAIERDARASGILALEEQGIIKARIEGLKKEDAALSGTISNREKSLSSIEAQIDKIEALIDKIEETRDRSIKAAKDEADRRQQIARDAAEAEIKAAQNVAREREKAARKASDAHIKAVNNARDAAIRAANDTADAEIKAAQRSIDNRVKLFQAAGKRITDVLKPIKDFQLAILDAQEKQIHKADRLANSLREQLKVLEVQAQIELSKALVSGLSQGDLIPFSSGAGFTNAWIIGELRRIQPGISNEVLRNLGLVNRQLGGIVPGAEANLD